MEGAGPVDGVPPTGPWTSPGDAHPSHRPDGAHDGVRIRRPKSERFPVPVPDECREGRRSGNGGYEGTRAYPAGDRVTRPSASKRARTGPERARANPAEAAQRAACERRRRLGQRVLDARTRRGGPAAWGRDRRWLAVDEVERERVALGAELDDEAVARRGGAVLDRPGSSVSPRRRR